MMNKNTFFVKTRTFSKSGEKFGYRPRYHKPAVREIDGLICREIAEYPTYAVSKCGILYDLANGFHPKEVRPKVNEYLKVTVKNFEGKLYTAVLHRLVALAWVPNVDWSKYQLVNHLDGNKLNPHADNLEWTDYSGNAHHAYATGLRSECLALRAKNIHTGIVTEAYGLNELARSCGIPAAEISTYLQTEMSYPLSSTWELRVADDDREWEFKSDGRLDNRSINEYIFTVGDKTYIFDKVRDIFSHFDLEMIPGYSFKQYLKQVEEAVGVKVEYKSLRPRTNSCQVLFHKDKSVRSYKSVNEAARKLNIPRTTLKRLFKKGPELVSHGISIRLESADDWPEKFIGNHKEKTGIKATSPKGEFIYKSIREAEKETGINQKAIARSIKTNMAYGEIVFTKL